MNEGLILPNGRPITQGAYARVWYIDQPDVDVPNVLYTMHEGLNHMDAREPKVQLEIAMRAAFAERIGEYPSVSYQNFPFLQDEIVAFTEAKEKELLSCRDQGKRDIIKMEIDIDPS